MKQTSKEIELSPRLPRPFKVTIFEWWLVSKYQWYSLKSEWWKTEESWTESTYVSARRTVHYDGQSCICWWIALSSNGTCAGTVDKLIILVMMMMMMMVVSDTNDNFGDDDDDGGEWY